MSDDEVEREPSRDGVPAEVIEGNPELPRIAKLNVFVPSSKQLDKSAAEACVIKCSFAPAISISVRYDYPE